MANLVDFLSSGSHSRVYFSTFFFTVLRKIDWNVQLCERNHGLAFLGGGRGGFFSLSEFEAVLDVSVLCCAACVRNERNLYSFFCFLFFPLRASQQIAALRTHAFSPSLDRPFLARSSWSVSSSAPPPPPSPLYLRTEHINKRRKEPLETESQGAVLWLCKVVYYYLLGRKKEKGFCKLALA